MGDNATKGKAEVYWCLDCGKIVSKESHGYHSADHTMRKYTMTKGWYSESPKSISKELHLWMGGKAVERENVVRFILNKKPGINADDFIMRAVNEGHLFESKIGFFRSVDF